MDMKNELPVSKSLIIHVEDATLARLELYRKEVYEETGIWRSYDYLIAKLLMRR